MTLNTGLASEGEMWGATHVRPFREEDASELAQFWLDNEFDIPGGVYPEDVVVDGPYVLESMKQGRTFVSTVAVRDGRIVGYHEIRRMTQTAVNLTYLYIDRKYRGCGFGVKFFFLLLRQVASLPWDTCRRAVGSYCPSNRVIQRIYDRIGGTLPRIGGAETFIPQLLNTAPFRRFALRHGLWGGYMKYAKCFSKNVPNVEELPVHEGSYGMLKRYSWKGMEVIPQRFECDGDWVDILLEASSRRICHTACPDWSISLMPNEDTNFQSNSIPFEVRFSNRSAVGKNYVLYDEEDEEIAKIQNVDPGETHSVFIHPSDEFCECRADIDGDPLFLAWDLSAQNMQWPPPVVSSKLLPVQSIENETLGLVFDPSLGGAVRSLTFGSNEVLRWTPEIGSLGWTHPWRGGLFTLTQEGNLSCRLQGFGPSPEYVGFNNPAVDWGKSSNSVFRVFENDELYEKVDFVLADSRLQINARIENRTGQTRKFTHALFIFLKTEPALVPIELVAFEGERKSCLRYGFEMNSRKEIAVSMPALKVKLRIADGRGEAIGFNFGDHGPHLMRRIEFDLLPKQHIDTTVQLLIER